MSPQRVDEPRTVIDPWGVLAWVLVVVASIGGPAWAVDQWVGLWQ